MLVKDMMSTELISIDSHANLAEAAQKMLERGVDALLVMHEGSLKGILGLRDLFTTPISASHADRMYNWRSERQLLEAWRSQTVYNLLNDEMLTVSDDLPLMQAAALMVNSGKHPLPVTRRGEIVGTIERIDVVRALLSSDDMS